jgi:hypothetical protein
MLVPQINPQPDGPIASFPQLNPTTDLPFVWGGGGQRLSPDDIDAKRKIAQALMAQGADYSPVGSWAQGLARVAQGVLGGFEERDLDKSAAANQAETQDTIAKLLAPGGGGGNAPLAALANPNLGSGAKTIAELLYKQNNPTPRAPGADEELLLAQGLVPGTPQYQSAAKALFDRKSDPIVTVSTPIGIYSGPQSQLGQFMGGGGQPSTGSPGASPSPPATLPPDFDFGAGGPKQPASGTFPIR